MSNTTQPTAEPKLKLTLKNEAGLAVISLAGRLDASTANEFDAAWAEALEDGANRCIVEMNGLDFISSAGLHSLLVLARRLDAAQGWFGCCGLLGNVQDVFAIAGFYKVFQVFDNLEQALAAAALAPAGEA